MFTTNGDKAATNHGTRNNVTSVKDLFPKSTTKKFANRYSGLIRIPHGELLQYVLTVYGSLYERDLIIYIEDGHVIKQEEIDHREEFSKLSDIEKYELGLQLKYNS